MHQMRDQSPVSRMRHLLNAMKITTGRGVISLGMYTLFRAPLTHPYSNVNILVPVLNDNTGCINVIRRDNEISVVHLQSCKPTVVRTDVLTS